MKNGLLAVVAASAILVWIVAVPAVRDAALALLPPRDGVVVADARVVSCPDARRDEPCRVRLISSGSRTTEIDLVRTGLFDTSVGERLPVRVEPRGTGVVATSVGWRPALDGALLLVLALLLTAQAIHRWQIVLDHDPYYGDDPFDPDVQGPTSSAPGPQAVSHES